MLSSLLPLDILINHERVNRLESGGNNMSFSVSKHLLYQDGYPVNFVRTPNGGKPLKPLYLIEHYTAGLTADGAIKWFQDSAAQASAHLIIDRDGSVTQMMEFNRVCWHAGRSEWQEIDGLNQYSIGIEIVNAGKLKRNASGKWLTWTDKIIPDADVIIATHKHETVETGWHRYTSEQLERVTEVSVALHQAYKFLDVLGHEDISPKRKTDPGPAFPMLSIQSKVMGRH